MQIKPTNCFMLGPAGTCCRVWEGISEEGQDFVLLAACMAIPGEIESQADETAASILKDVGGLLDQETMSMIEDCLKAQEEAGVEEPRAFLTPQAPPGFIDGVMGEG